MHGEFSALSPINIQHLSRVNIAVSQERERGGGVLCSQNAISKVQTRAVYAVKALE